jgi:hypothetical protein
MHPYQFALTSTQPQNQHLVVLHRRLTVSRTLRRLIHHLEVHLAMGILDPHHTLGCSLDLNRWFHG